MGGPQGGLTPFERTKQEPASYFPYYQSSSIWRRQPKQSSSQEFAIFLENFSMKEASKRFIIYFYHDDNIVKNLIFSVHYDHFWPDSKLKDFAMFMTSIGFIKSCITSDSLRFYIMLNDVILY